MMDKQNFRALVVLVMGIGAFFVSCVSPFYGTARIEKGWHMNAGAAAASYFYPLMNSYWPDPYCIGGRADFTLEYGFNKYFEIRGQIGLGTGISIPDSGIKSGRYPLGEGTLALQAALPCKIISPAISLGYSYPSGP